MTTIFHFPDGTTLDCIDEWAPKRARLYCRYNGATVEAPDQDVLDKIAFVLQEEVPLFVPPEGQPPLVPPAADGTLTGASAPEASPASPNPLGLPKGSSRVVKESPDGKSEEQG